jgi:hypothetical protein
VDACSDAILFKFPPRGLLKGKIRLRLANKSHP